MDAYTTVLTLPNLEWPWPPLAPPPMYNIYMHGVSIGIYTYFCQSMYLEAISYSSELFGSVKTNAGERKRLEDYQCFLVFKK